MYSCVCFHLDRGRAGRQHLRTKLPTPIHPPPPPPTNVTANTSRHRALVIRAEKPWEIQGAKAAYGAWAGHR
jgi:hypothetical protein